MRNAFRICGMACAAWLSVVVAACAEDSTTRQIRALMQENFEASNREDLEGVLATMSEEMPQRELFIQQCKREWEASDLYYRLDDVKVVRQTKWRPPYLVATVRQTITGNEGQAQDRKLSDIMSLNTDVPSTEQEVLFKRERGSWKLVACVTEPRPVGSKDVKEAVTSGPCADGSCRWPRSKP